MSGEGDECVVSFDVTDNQCRLASLPPSLRPRVATTSRRGGRGCEPSADGTYASTRDQAGRPLPTGAGLRISVTAHLVRLGLGQEPALRQVIRPDDPDDIPVVTRRPSEAVGETVALERFVRAGERGTSPTSSGRSPNEAVATERQRRGPRPPPARRRSPRPTRPSRTSVGQRPGPRAQ